MIEYDTLVIAVGNTEKALYLAYKYNNKNYKLRKQPYAYGP